MYEINKMPSAIDIGFTGEKLFREIQIDMTKWMQQMPDGVPSIVHIRPGETEADAYIAATTFEDNILTWQITNGDLGEIEGTGLMQIWLEEEENSSVVKRGKSILVVTRISRAINDADGTTPAAQEAWLEQMTALKVATVNAAEDADDAKDDAVAAKTAAETAQGKAEDSAEDAEAYAIGKRNGTDVGSSDPAYHNNSKYYAGEADTAKTAAEAAKDAAQSAVLHYPYVDPVSGNWMVWDASTEAFVDTNVHAQGATGTVPDIEIGTVTTLLPGSQATVERRSGSPDTAPVFDFGIPKGDTGQAENIYGNTIDMSESDSTKVATEIGKKANKVTSATSGHFAGLDSNGDLVDSGKQASDFTLELIHNSDMDGLAIIINGNKASKNVSTGDYVLVENSTISGIADGGYKALSNVSAGTAFAASDLSALTKGAVTLIGEDVAILNGKIATASFGENVPSNADFNNYKTPGYYRVANTTVSPTVANIPVSSAGVLHVEIANTDDTSSRIFQTYRVLNNNNEYKRSLTSNGWTEWNSLNDQISTSYDSVAYAKLTDIQSALGTIAASLPVDQTKFIRIHTGTDTSLAPFTAWNDFIGYMQRQSTNYWIATLVGRDGVDVTVTCSNGTLRTYSLNSKTTSVSGTMSSTANTEVQVSYPTGFNASNCVIVGYATKTANGVWYSNNPNIVCMADGNNGVRIKTSDATFLGTPFTVMLMKI